MDLATSIQQVIEEIVSRLGRCIGGETGQRNLCLARGVALNCVANGELLREGVFDNIWIQPAAGDAGGSLGAALATHYLMNDAPRTNLPGADSIQSTYLGPEYGRSSIERELAAMGAVFSTVTNDELIQTPRPGSCRRHGRRTASIPYGIWSTCPWWTLHTCRSVQPQRAENLEFESEIGESFRPFAPSVPREHLTDWFDLNVDSPYMVLVTSIRTSQQVPMSAEQQALSGIEKLNVTRSTIPAVTHVDYTARIQTVHADSNPRYHALLTRF